MGLVSRIGRGQHWLQFRSFSSVSSDSALQLELFIGRWHSQHRAWRTALQARRDAHSSSGVASDLSEVWPVPGGAAQLWPIAHLAGQHRSVTSLSCLSHFRIPHLQFSSHKASISVPILSFFLEAELRLSQAFRNTINVFTAVPTQVQILMVYGVCWKTAAASLKRFRDSSKIVFQRHWLKIKQIFSLRALLNAGT